MDDHLPVAVMCIDPCHWVSHCLDPGNIIKNIEKVMMRKFNKEDYDAVKSYERDFIRAIDSRYCTGLVQEELQVVQKIYAECLNRQANLSCGGCVLQMMTSVGRLYLGFKKEYEKQKRIRRKKNEDKVENSADKGMHKPESDNQ